MTTTLYSKLKTAGVVPVSLSDFKNFIRQYATFEDTTLTDILASAVQTAEEYLSVALAKQTRTARTLPIKGQPERELVMDIGPVQSINSVSYFDSSGAQQTIDPSFYELVDDTVRPVLGQSWPSIDPNHLAAFTVEYVAGTADYTVSPKKELDSIYRTGIFLFGQAIYERREECAEAAQNLLSTRRKGQGV